MARPESSILAKDTGRTQTAAFAVLWALAAAQLALLGWSARETLRSPLENAPPAAPAAHRPSDISPIPATEAASLLTPPRPGELAGDSGAAASVTPGMMPPAPGMLAGDAPPQMPAVPLQSGAAPGSLPDLPVPDPEVAELLQTVAQLRSGGETDGLLELLRAAEGMDQNHPAVLKEFALTYEQMGLPDKAREYWRRIVAGGEAAGGMFFRLARQRLERLGTALAAPAVPPGPETALTPPNMVGGMPALPESGNQVTREPGAQLGVGPCQVVIDPSVANGDRRTLRIPILKLGNDPIEPSAVNVDVFFYDRVNGQKVEPTRADPPVANWIASPVDWAGEKMEPLDVIYSLPPMTAAEVKNHGRRTFHGYLVKLYYQDRLQAVVAEPRELLDATQASSASPSSPTAPGR